MELFKLFGTLALNGVNETENQIDEVTDKAERSSNKISSAFKKIGLAVASAFAVGKIKEFGTAVVQAAAEVSAEESAFTQIMGEYSDEAASKVQKIADATGIVDSRLTPYMTSLTAKFKGLGYDITDATDYAQRGLNLAADAAAFWDKSLDDSMSHLNSFINGSYEGGEAIGLFANDTQMAAYAVQKGIVSSTAAWAKLDEKTKQATRLEYAENMFAQSGATGQAAKESDQYANVMANLNEQWRQFKAQVGEPILQNIVIPAMQVLSDLLTNTLIPAVQNVVAWITEHKEQLIQLIKVLASVTAAVLSLVAAWKAALMIQKLTQAFQAAQLQLSLYKLETNGASIAQGLLNGQLTLGQIIVGLLTGKITLAQLATQLWTAAQTGLNTALNANPIGAIIMLVIGLVAILIAAYKHSTTFREAIKELWNEIKEGLQPIIEALKPLLSSIINLFKQIWSLISTIVIPIFNLIVTVLTHVVEAVTPILQTLFDVFNAVFKPIIAVVTKVVEVITSIVGAITKAVNAVKSGIEKIKSFFNFKFEWPKLKLPHFSITPDGWKIGDLLKGKIPKLGIKWYADGAIFTQPTLFNTANGIKGVGEAGAEAVAPIDKLTGYVQQAVQGETDGLGEKVDRLVDMLANYFPEILNNMSQNIVLNDGALVGKLAPKLNVKLADIQKSNERGR